MEYSDELSPRGGEVLHPQAPGEVTHATEALAIVLILVVLTIFFEKAKHAAEHHAGRALRPIVAALFGELTVLGFLSVVTYFMERAGAFVELSRMISALGGPGKTEEDVEGGGEGEEGEEELFELVETIHFSMFFVMVIFLVQILAEVHDGLQSQKEWCRWDRACRDEAYVKGLLQESAKMDKESDAISSMPGIGGMARRMCRFLSPYLSFLPFMRNRTKESLEDKVEFCSLRREFFKERSPDPPFAPAGDEEGGPPKNIGDHFNFGSYLTHAYAKKMTAVIEVDVKTWLLFAGGAVCYFVLFDALGFSVQHLAWAWVFTGWGFHILSVIFEKYLLGIRDRFMAPEFVPRPRLRELSFYNLNSMDIGDDPDTGTEKEPLQWVKNGNHPQYQRAEQDEELPVWCNIDLDELNNRRSPLAKAIFGPTPQNRQHALYLFGHDGPAFHILCIRVMLVFSCIYSAQLAIVFFPTLARDDNTSTAAFIVYCVLAAVPALAFIFNKKRFIATLVQVGCIGSFVLPHAIAESERQERASVAVRIFAIYYKLACTAQEFIKNPSLFKMDCASGHYTNIFTLEDISELGRIFSAYLDHDGDGILSGIELQRIMSTVGIAMTGEEARKLVEAIAKAVESDYVDGEMRLTKEAFFQWYADQLGKNNDTKRCAEFLFALFDEDNSSDITVMEFKQQLDKLALGITQEEAVELIEELDQDGNGVLCKEEFEEMIESFWPVEFEELVG